MKIALFAVGDAAWQGGIQYITNLLFALDAIADEETIEVHLFKNEHQHFPGLEKLKRLQLTISAVNSVFEPFSLYNRLVWFVQRKLQGRLIPRFENYFLKNKFDFVFPIRLSDCNGRLNVGAWIADFQYHHFPDGANPETTRKAEQLIGDIANNARKVVLSSNYCQNDCLRLFPLSEGKTFVMPFAVHIDKSVLAFNKFEEVRAKYSLPEKFLIVANLFAPTKNHVTLFNALGILKRKGLIIDLVCTGNIVDYRNQSYANDILKMLTENGIRSQVHLLGLIDRNDQVAMFRMSTAMVQPSINEGWSTSVEEAKCLGKYLLVSDIDVHREQSRNNPLMFSALNPQSLADKIEELWNDTSSTAFPETEKESRANDNYQNQIKDFGRRFVELVKFAPKTK